MDEIQINNAYVCIDKKLQLKIPIYLIAVLIFLLQAQSFSQEMIYTHFNTFDGLPSSQVYDVYEDVNGFIWFATDRGVSRFDGYVFKNFGLNEGLPSTTVFKFFEQDDGTVWCSTIQNRLFYFHPKDYIIHKYKFNKTLEIECKGALIEDFYRDKNKDIFLGFQNSYDYVSINDKGVCTKKINTLFVAEDLNKTILCNVELNKKESFNFLVPANYAEAIGLEKFEKLQINNYKLNYKTGYYKAVNTESSYTYSHGKELFICSTSGVNKKVVFDHQIIGLGLFSSNKIWIGFNNGGGLIYNIKTEEIIYIASVNSISSVLNDSQGGIWVTTIDHGVLYFEQGLGGIKKFGEKSIFDMEAIHDNQIVFSDIQGQIWKTNSEQINLIYQTNNKIAAKVKFDPRTTTLYTGFSGTSTSNDLKIKSSSFYLVDFKIRNNLTLFASPWSLQETVNYKSKNPLIIRIKCVEWIDDNNVFVGSEGGLYKYNFKSKKLTKCNYQFLNQRITDIKKTNDTYWFSTFGNGVISLKNGKIKQFSESNGLTSNFVTNLFVENMNSIWASTDNGLSCILSPSDTSKKKIFRMDRILLEKEISDVIIIDNKIWMGTRSGLFLVNKSSAFKKKKTPNLKLNWLSILVNNKKVGFDKLDNLSFDQNSIDFNIQSIFYGNKSNLKGQYRLNNKEWRKLSGRSVHLEALSEGSYHLTIRYSLNGLDWNKNKLNLAFTIYPPFYKSNWFLLTIACLICLIIYLFFKFRVLLYNRLLVKEMLRLIVRKLNPKVKSFIITEQGRNYRINSMDILFLKSEGNYLTINLINKKHTIRHKIGEYDKLVPDKIEYLRVNKSYVIRMDKVTGKNLDFIFLGNLEIPIGNTYKKELEGIVF